MYTNPIRRLRDRACLTQAALADVGGTSQPTIAAYETGVKVPNLTTAERLAEAAGLELAIEFLPPLTREDRRSLALHRAIASRLREDPRATLALARRNLRRMIRLHPQASTTLHQWNALLTLPVDHLVDLLVDPRPFARELRHVTPFAGALGPGARARVYREFGDADLDRRRS